MTFGIQQREHEIQNQKETSDKIHQQLKNMFSDQSWDINQIHASITEIDTKIKKYEAQRQIVEQSETIDTDTFLHIILMIEQLKKEHEKLVDIWQKSRADSQLKEMIHHNQEILDKRKKEVSELKERIKSLPVVSDEKDSLMIPGKQYLILTSSLIGNTIVSYTFNGNDEEPEIKKIELGHGKNNCYFELNEESDGTRRIIELLEILWSVQHGTKRVFLVDEVDRSLHPDLTRNLVETYLSLLEKDTETQLIVTTHESRIMDLNLLRQDEIWFVDKNVEGISSLYSLEEFDERFDRRIDKAYFDGRYGGIPYFNDSLSKRNDETVIE